MLGFDSVIKFEHCFAGNSEQMSRTMAIVGCLLAIVSEEPEIHIGGELKVGQRQWRWSMDEIDRSYVSILMAHVSFGSRPSSDQLLVQRIDVEVTESGDPASTSTSG